jgi:guanine deaminase
LTGRVEESVLEQNTDKWMRRAIQLSVQNVLEGKGGPFAALVVQGEHVVGEGVNRVTSENDPTAHAEIVAIRNACRVLGQFSLAGCTLYSTCEPCPMCWGAIYWARLDRVYYAASMQDAARAGFDDAKFFEELKQPYQARSIPITQIQREDALKAFDAWVRKPGKILY